MYTEDGGAILRDGKPMTIPELLTVLNIYEADLQFIRRQISARVGTSNPFSGKPGWVEK